jgi:hypothetical protein
MVLVPEDNDRLRNKIIGTLKIATASVSEKNRKILPKKFDFDWARLQEKPLVELIQMAYDFANSEIVITACDERMSMPSPPNMTTSKRIFFEKFKIYLAGVRDTLRSIYGNDVFKME